MEAPVINFNHSLPVQIRFNDIDMMGHVTNTVHLALCDNGRMDYFDKVLSEKIEFKDESLVIASITVDFFVPVFLYEKIHVSTKVHTLGNKSLQMVRHLINSETGEVKSQIRSILSGFNYIDQHSIEIPQRWKEAIIQFEKDVVIKSSSSKASI